MQWERDRLWHVYALIRIKQGKACGEENHGSIIVCLKCTWQRRRAWILCNMSTGKSAINLPKRGIPPPIVDHKRASCSILKTWLKLWGDQTPIPESLTCFHQISISFLCALPSSQKRPLCTNSNLVTLTKKHFNQNSHTSQIQHYWPVRATVQVVHVSCVTYVTVLVHTSEQTYHIQHTFSCFTVQLWSTTFRWIFIIPHV